MKGCLAAAIVLVAAAYNISLAAGSAASTAAAARPVPGAGVPRTPDQEHREKREEILREKLQDPPRGTPEPTLLLSNRRRRFYDGKLWYSYSRSHIDIGCTENNGSYACEDEGKLTFAVQTNESEWRMAYLT